jgi:hypothetical protein
MTAIGNEATFHVNTFGFNLPCRQFAIAAERTRERRLPMVDEFILRALHLVETIPASRLARFFGFEGRDLGISIADLQTKGYVQVEGEAISLTQLGKELFRTSDESAPTITIAEPMHADVWFDLVTKHMVAGRGLRNVQHLIPIRGSSSREVFEADDARQAFHNHFRDYLRIARNDKNADQWSLYSILDVHPGRFSFAQIGGGEILTLTPAPKLETFLISTQLDYANRTRRLTESMIAELSGRSHVESSHAARSDYSRLAANRNLQQATGDDGLVDLLSWLRAEISASNGSTQPIVGYPYVEANRSTISRLLAGVKFDGDTWELWWLRPGGSRWGATEDLPATLELLRTTVRSSGRERGLATALLCPAGVGLHEASVFQRVFDRGLHAKPGQSSLALEILVIPDVLAVVTVVVALSPTVNVPIGFVTVDPQRVKAIVETSQIDEAISSSSRLWPQTATAQKGRRDQAGT